MIPHHPNQISPSVSGDAAKTNPAPVTASLGPGAGEVIGKTPWREVAIDGISAVTVKDWNGNTLFVTSPRIAHLAVTGVNAWTKLFGDVTKHRDVLRGLQKQLIPLRALPSIRPALELIDRTLNPEADSLS